MANSLILDADGGPISIAMGLESPEAEIVAVDVNERALELTELNAKNAGLKHIRTSLVDDALKENNTLEFNNFDLIWSNPPIRVGKEMLHDILMTWIPRLKVGGAAYLVVQKKILAQTHLFLGLLKILAKTT